VNRRGQNPHSQQQARQNLARLRVRKRQRRREVWAERVLIGHDENGTPIYRVPRGAGTWMGID